MYIEIKNQLGKRGRDLTGSGYGNVAGSCELSGSKKFGEFLD
jgi:hypothetical protein